VWVTQIYILNQTVQIFFVKKGDSAVGKKMKDTGSKI